MMKKITGADNYRLIQRAAQLAWKYHRSQIRKADGTAYIIHPAMVVAILAKHRFSDEALVAAWCHDLLEDTNCPPAEIAKVCGRKVLRIVKAVTNPDTEDWERKKLAYIRSVAAGSMEAKAICVADKIHNLSCLIEAHDRLGKAVWRKFNRGRESKLWFEKQVLAMLRKSWKHPLIDQYERLLDKYPQ